MTNGNMDTENCKGIKEEEETDQSLKGLFGLLSDYSSRAVGWASIFVASIFGMFTLLTVIEKPIEGIIWISIYSLLWILGAYSIISFEWYADLRDKITAEIWKSSPEFKRKTDEIFKLSEKGIWSWMHKFARWRLNHPTLTIILLILFYVIITWAPFILVLYVKSIPLFSEAIFKITSKVGENVSLISISLQTSATVLFSIGGFFLGNFTSDRSDIELYTKLYESADLHSHLAATSDGLSMILNQAYKKEANMWKNAVEIQKKTAKRNLTRGVFILIIGSIIFFLCLLYQ